MRIDVFTIFPGLVRDMGMLSVLGRAQEAELLDLRVHDLRMTTTDPHGTVDDKPFGGGPGMIMKPEPFFEAVDLVEPPRPILLLDPGGKGYLHDDIQAAR